ncbi:hypothetical protein Tco_1507662 [Tanacetum coccineum]
MEFTPYYILYLYTYEVASLVGVVAMCQDYSGGRTRQLKSLFVAPLGDIEFPASTSENSLSSACSSSKGNRIVRVLPPLTLLRTSAYSFYIPADIHPN